MVQICTAIFTRADLIIDSPTANWTPIAYPGGNRTLLQTSRQAAPRPTWSETSIESPPMINFVQVLSPSPVANYDWQAVNSIIDPGATDFDIDNGSTQSGNDPTDYFLSFQPAL